MSEHKKISIQSKSFAILFAVALVGTYLCLVYSQKVIGGEGRNGSFLFYHSEPLYKTTVYSNTPTPVASQPTTNSVNTSDWKTLTNTKYGFTMLYPKTWSVKNLSVQGDYYVYEIRPTAKSDPISLHINRQSFRALEGLASTTEKLNGDQLINIKGQLYGLAHEEVHMTFDLGVNLSEEEEFSAMVHSVKFQ